MRTKQTPMLRYVYPKNVQGHRYLYFRMPETQKLVRLPDDVSSAEFRREYVRCFHLAQRQVLAKWEIKVGNLKKALGNH